jgi:hypothetical protein
MYGRWRNPAHGRAGEKTKGITGEEGGGGASVTVMMKISSRRIYGIYTRLQERVSKW